MERREREGDRLGGAGEGVGVGESTGDSQRGEQAWAWAWGAGGRLGALWEPSDVLALPAAGREGGRGDAARAEPAEGGGWKEAPGGDLSFSESM